MDEDELCLSILNPFPVSWESFCHSIRAKLEPRTFNNLFDWFMEEEVRLNSRKTRGPPPAQEEENHALMGKERKWKGKKRFVRKKSYTKRYSPKPSSKTSPKRIFKKEKLHIKCFECSKMGQYESECPTKAKERYHAHTNNMNDNEE